MLLPMSSGFQTGRFACSRNCSGVSDAEKGGDCSAGEVPAIVMGGTAATM
jgi:hypothetical protein